MHRVELADRHPGRGAGQVGAHPGGTPHATAVVRCRWRPAILAVLAVAVLAAGCDTAGDGDAAGDGAATGPDETAEQPGDAGEPDTPGDGATVGLAPVGEVSPGDVPADADLDALEGLPVLSGLAWTMHAIGPDGPPDPAEVEAALTEEFLAQVPAEEFISLMAQVQGDWRVAALESVESNQLAVELATGDQRLQMQLEVTDEDPAEIAGLLLQPPLGDPAEFDDWEEAEAALTGLADEVVFLAATVEDGSCEPVAARNPDQRGPLASTFKLYVLGALVDAVAEGTIAFDDELEITEERKSLPSGVLQAEEPGSTVTVAEAAELMIEISDNTATDLLIHALGREAVEDAQAAYGHTDPSVNQPFVTTREMFQLAASPEVTERFLDAGTEGRREILAGLAGEPLPEAADLELEPSVPQRPGWYASPTEVCEALVALDEATAAEGMEPARVAFGAEPPPRIDDDLALIGAKAGGQPGVQSRAWLLERDGTRVAFTASLDHSATIDVASLLPALEGAVALLADLP